jgi:hypothetical protein
LRKRKRQRTFVVKVGFDFERDLFITSLHGNYRYHRNKIAKKKKEEEKEKNRAESVK